MKPIDADKFKENLMKLWDYSCVDGVTATDVLKRVILDLVNAPTIPLFVFRSRPKGEWKLDSVGPYCSECKKHPDYSSDFCPFCGADMRGGEE